MRFSPQRTAIAVCVLIAVVHISAASAAPTPSFGDLLKQAEATAPRLLENSAEIAVVSGRARQAAAWPNPEFGVEVENFGGTGPYRGSSLTQTTFSLSEPLELVGQRGARVRAGSAELAAAKARGQQSRLAFIHDLALAYATAEVSQSRVYLLTEDLDRTQEDVRRARALVDAGKEGELRAVQANAAAAGARADLEEARATAVESLNQLSSLVGAREPFTSIGPSLLASGSAAPAPAAEAPASAPAVLAAQAELETAERRIHVERKRALPVLALSVGARRFKGENATALVGGVSMSLPLFDQNRGAIAAARAERSAADARLAGARLEVEAAWRAASAQQNAAAARLMATSQGEAAASEAYRLARIGYEAGRSSLLELLSTRRVLIEAQLRSLDARLARVRAEASLALLAGQIPFGE